MLSWIGFLVVTPPFLLVGFLGISSLLQWRLQERTINRAIQAAVVTGLLASIAILGIMLLVGTRHVAIDLGDWIALPFFQFEVRFVFDRLSVPFAILSFTLSGTIAAFATRYMHRERGYNRFFVLYSLFVLGMVTASLADNSQTLFVGWELVGLSSALLVAFYQERPAPSRNGLWVWVVYRISDAALLLAAVVLHHAAADFERPFGTGPWPEGHSSLEPGRAFLVGLLLLIAAAGKSGLVPFSGWLPRAMEGPTPSSAIFYGALSVHLGAFLLLRVSPILDRSAAMCALIVVLGLLTSLHAYLAGSVQTDIKSALSFACLTQVGFIFVEIGLGLRYFALVHLLGHACLRTLQLIRAPSLLHEYHTLENAIGEHLPRQQGPLPGMPGTAANVWLYRLALDRGYLDAWLSAYVVAPFVRFFRACERLEQSWTELLSGQKALEPSEVKPYQATFEDVI